VLRSRGGAGVAGDSSRGDGAVAEGSAGGGEGIAKGRIAVGEGIFGEGEQNGNGCGGEGRSGDITPADGVAGTDLQLELALTHHRGPARHGCWACPSARCG